MCQNMPKCRGDQILIKNASTKWTWEHIWVTGWVDPRDQRNSKDEYGNDRWKDDAAYGPDFDGFSGESR